MIRCFRPAPEGGLQASDGLPDQLDDAIVWVDMVSPGAAEKVALEALLGFTIPSLEDMREIEISSRLFTASGATFMTASVPADRGDGQIVAGPVTFILFGNLLVTLRYHDPRAFASIGKRIRKLGLDCSGGTAVMVALIEAIVDNIADMLEDTGRAIEALTRSVFEETPPGDTQGGLQAVLRGIGAVDDTLTKAVDSLTTQTRLVDFLNQNRAETQRKNPFSRRLRVVGRDLHSLVEHAGFLSGKVAFQLDATLGMINIEQNNIMKIFTVVSVVLLPPTLIGSIYGMNFRFMPELGWPWGYPAALGAMVISALVPYLWFRFRGWL